MLRRVVVLLLCALAAAPAFARLPAPVAAEIERAGIPSSSVALVVQDVNDAAPLLSHNADRAMNPASVMKLITGFAALELLGPAYTWRTEVYLDGPLEDGVLHGDLILKGYGDPKLTVERFWLLLKELRARGLRDIKGDLVLDRSYFDPGMHDAARFDREPLRPYNVGADALLLNFKAVRFAFIPDPHTRTVNILSQPPLAQLRLENEVATVEGPCEDWRRDIKPLVAEEGDRVTVRFAGAMPDQCDTRHWALALLPADKFAWGMFHAMWHELGGTLSGSVRDGLVPLGAVPFAVLESQSAAEAVRDMNKYSSNVIARQLFLTISAERQPPGRYDTSAEIVRDWLAERGLAMPELSIENGSGLSRIARVSAGNLVRLLIAAYRSPVMPEFIASLPLVAADGTMQKRLQYSAVAGQAHVKTGSLNDVRSLAGYVDTEDGRRLAFAFIVNHPQAAASQAAQDELLRWLYRDAPRHHRHRRR